MITTEEISIKVYQMLKASPVASMISGSIGYQREDYTKEDVVIVPHTVDGEGSVRFGQINVNIHVPDLKSRGKSVYITNIKRLVEIRGAVIDALQSHYESGTGYNWTIGRINPPIKEQGFDEHFVSIALAITIRENN